MSWIFGVYHRTGIGITLSDEIARKAVHRIENGRIRLYAGGNKNNLFCTSDPAGQKGWIVSGVGLKISSKGTVLFTGQDWADALNQPNTLNGHFIAVQWDGDVLSVRTDSQGLRDIYIAETEHAVFFSTRIDWLAPWVRLDLDFSVFGSRWLLYNQLSADSILKAVKRITRGECWRTDGWSVKPVSTVQDEKPDDYLTRLTRLITLPDKALSLSLSGGLDSRVLLAVLLSAKNQDWNTHTFGPESSADVRLTKKMAAELGFAHHHIELPVPPADTLLREVSDYTAHTLVNNPASAVLQLRNYREIDTASVVIDGGFGEIWRGEFLYKLQLRGQKALSDRNLPALAALLRSPRADLFRTEHDRIMQEGCLSQLDQLFHDLPPLRETGPDRWLDLFALRTRLINTYSPEQTWLDQVVTGYMPYIQPVLLALSEQISPSAKRDGRLFKQLIKQTVPRLGRFPLAKGSGSHPFSLTSLQARVWTRLLKRYSGPAATDSHRRLLLGNLDEWITDTVLSGSTRESEWFDYQKVSAAYTQYRQTGDSPALDWWIAIHCFQQKIQPGR